MSPRRPAVRDQIVAAQTAAAPTQPTETSSLLPNGNNTYQDAEALEIPSISQKKILIIMCSAWMGTLMAALDSTIITTLLAPISTSFNSFSSISWVATAYLISNSAFQPLFGKLTDIYGRRAGLIFSNVFFGVGTLICGLATKEWHLIAGRVIAGIGGGGLNAISTFIGSDLIPLRQRGLFQGIGNIVWGVGSGLGGSFGGFLNDSIGWRWAFLIQVPFVCISGLLVSIFVNIPIKETGERPLRRVDFMGSFTLVSTLLCLLMALNSGGNIFPWNHPLIPTMLTLSAVMFCAFLYVEQYWAREPVIPLFLFNNRTVISACLLSWLFTMAQFINHFHAPLYFQLLGTSPAGAGLRLIPQAIGISVGSLTVGTGMRLTGRYYILNIIVNSVFILGVFLVSTFNLNTSTWQQYTYLFFTGAGYGGMLTVTLLSLIASVEHVHQAVITSASYAFRATGSVIGVAVGGAVFQNVLRTALNARLLRFGEEGREVIRRVLKSWDEIGKVDGKWHGLVLESYMEALRSVFLVGLGLASLAWFIGLFIREHKLHKTIERR